MKLQTGNRTLKNLRLTARLVGVRVNDDGTEIRAYGYHRHLPVRGTRVRVEQGAPRVTAGRVLALGVLALAAKKTDVYLIFTNGTDELAVLVPSSGRKRVQGFTTAFNTYAGQTQLNW